MTDPGAIARADQIRTLAVDLSMGVWHAGHLHDDGRRIEAQRIRQDISRRLRRMSDDERLELESMLLTMTAATMTATGRERRTVETMLEDLEHERAHLRRSRIVTQVFAIGCAGAAVWNVALILAR